MDGVVDEVRITAAVSGGSLALPRFTVKHNTAPWNAVYFAEDGTLDLRFHPGPVRIEIERDRRSRAVSVNMFGLTTRHEMEKAEKPVTEESESEKRKLQESQTKKIKLKSGSE